MELRKFKIYTLGEFVGRSTSQKQLLQYLKVVKETNITPNTSQAITIPLCAVKFTSREKKPGFILQ